MAAINPFEVSQSVKNVYARYLRSLMRPSDINIATELDRVISTGVAGEAGILKGPFIEAQPPYVKDVSIRQLVEEGVLNSGFLRFSPENLPIDRNLYSHQVRSIRRVAEGNNVIVATGTGSGKTESFLLPILNELLTELAANTLGPGVRALLLYPMNALANDQVKRLRKILARTPEITFGRYTGETEQSTDLALQDYRARNNGQEPLPNELISREQMQATPPHILLTNFAMLEYLLLRPADSSLFDGPSAKTWKFLVADEAHTYDGAHGVEVSNLITKLRERVDPTKRMQAIGTTATIGSDKDDIGGFAEAFFGNSFDISEESSLDLIEPIRNELPTSSWGTLSAEDWIRLDAGELNFEDLEVGSAKSDIEICQFESRVVHLRKLLLAGPAMFQDVASIIFPEATGETESESLAIAGLLALINVCSRTKDELGEPAISARFHLFARATEGVFSCLNQQPHMSLSRHKACETCESRSYELGGCKKCGGTYFLGSIQKKGNQQFFDSVTNFGTQQICLYPDLSSADIEDADLDIHDEDFDAKPANETPVYLCRKCALLSPIHITQCPNCEAADILVMRQLEGPATSQGKCPQCNSISPGILRKLASGNDAAASVLASEVYSNLPEDSQKLMIFSDSRQQAAFFAPYLQTSHERILWRQIIRKALESCEATKAPGSILRQTDIVAQVQALVASDSLIEGSKNIGINAVREQVFKRLHWEAVSTDSQLNLEGTGIVQWSMALPEDASCYSKFEGLGIDISTSKALLQQLLATLREGGILSNASATADADDLFAPRRGPLWVRGHGADKKRKIFAWIPDTATNARNRRSDYVERVLQSLGLEKTVNSNELLEGIWRLLSDAGSPFSKLLKRENDRVAGPLWRLNHEFLQIQLATPDAQFFNCNVCGRTTPFNAGDVCGRFKCTGKLVSIDFDSSMWNQHYRSLYQRSAIAGLIAREHTAQLSKKEASETQQKFIDGEINVLSSSTTFELGVDVGELQAVLLRNVPPSTANYLQRAGRAGRRSDSAALILTYAQRRPHDLAQFANPLRMIAGEMRAPYVNLDNARIFMRHMYSVFFATYFKAFPSTFGDAQGLFLPNSDGSTSIEHMGRWLEENETALKFRYQALLPGELEVFKEKLWVEILESFQELTSLVSKTFGANIDEYTKLILDLQADYIDSTKSLNERRRAATSADRLEKARDALKERDIIGFLSTQNLLPKYGFPVDTVNLIPRYTDAGAKDIDLNRDLTLAIFEYAPGNQLIANGALWESVGLEVPAGKALERIAYAGCGACGHLHKQLADKVSFPVLCPSCGVGGLTPHEYVQPKWGFIANRLDNAPGESLKSSPWSRKVYLSSIGRNDDDLVVESPSDRVRANLQNIAKILIVNEGNFAICDWCNRAHNYTGKTAKSHQKPNLLAKECTGFMRPGVRLGHEYETDLVQIELNLSDSGLLPDEVGVSTQYALVQAASDLLQVAQDDLDVVKVGQTATTYTFAIIDAVPAGAGFATLVAKHLKSIFSRALDLVADCECGPETSCYECLRNYSNQRLHEDLKRENAVDALTFLIHGKRQNAD